MKTKVEMSQSDMVDLLMEKVNFLNQEYSKLYSTFTIDKKNKVTVDTIKLTESYESYLKTSGDIERLTKIYELFVDDTKPKKTVS